MGWFIHLWLFIGDGEPRPPNYVRQMSKHKNMKFGNQIIENVSQMYFCIKECVSKIQCLGSITIGKNLLFDLLEKVLDSNIVLL